VQKLHKNEYVTRTSKALFASLEGKGRKGLEKKEGVSERNSGHWKEGLIFLQNIKPSSFGGTKKLYWRRVLGGLGEFI